MPTIRAACSCGKRLRLDVLRRDAREWVARRLAEWVLEHTGRGHRRLAIIACALLATAVAAQEVTFDRVGIGIAPRHRLHIAETTDAQSSIRVDHSVTTWNGATRISPVDVRFTFSPIGNTPRAFGGEALRAVLNYGDGGRPTIGTAGVVAAEYYAQGTAGPTTSA